MTAFDQAWAVAKTPYYHGTSSREVESILERGIIPGPQAEGNWPDDWQMSESPYDAVEDHSDPMKDPRSSWAFMSAEPNQALSYALGSWKAENRHPPHRPSIIEIANEAEGLEGFEYQQPFHDFRVSETIPPSMLRLVHEGEEYRDLNRHWDRHDDPADARRYIDDEMIVESDQQHTRLRESPWFERYMAMGDKRHPPWILREGLY